MKVGYINYIRDIGSNLGVLRKLNNQGRALNDLDLPMSIVLFTENAGDFAESAPFVDIQVLEPKRNPFTRHIAMLKAIVSFANPRFDTVLLRHVGFSPFSIPILARRTFCLATEHHTLDLDQLKLEGRTVPYLLEKWSTTWNRQRIEGCLAVTKEILDHQLAFGALPETARVISNGVCVADIPKTGSLAWQGGPCKMVFVASWFSPWLGLDRVLAGLANYQGRAEIELHLVGKAPSDEDMGAFDLPETVRVKRHGPLYGQAMDEVMAGAHLGIAACAIHRKGMQSGCGLKVREYMARGLPFLHSNHDGDLIPGAPYVLDVPPDDSPLNISEVLSFVEGLSALDRTSLVDEMRAFAEENLDWKAKMQSYWQYAQRLEALAKGRKGSKGLWLHDRTHTS